MPNSEYKAQLQSAVHEIGTLLSTGGHDVTRALDLVRLVGRESEQSSSPEIASVARQAEEFLTRYLDDASAIDPEIFENLMLNLQSICRTALSRTGS